MACKIDSLVTESVATLDEHATVQTAAELMAALRVGSVVVTGAGGVTGMFTERDLVRRVVAVSLDPRQVTLGEVCSRDLVSISADSSCHRAVIKMRTHACRRLLVFRGERFKGIVKLTDVANAMADQRRQKDVLMNLVVAGTLAVACSVIATLVYHLPQMWRLAEHLGTY
jgi:CBS domain-containing protein